MAKVIRRSGAGASGAVGSGSTPAALKLAWANSQAQQGAFYNGALLATGGVAPYTFSLTGGSLPAGLSLNTSTGAVTGTPSVVGAFTPVFMVTDAATTTASVTATINVVSPSGASTILLVSSVTGDDEGHGSDVVSTDASRLTSFLVGVTCTFATTPTQYNLVWLSKDAGTTWTPINWYLWTASGQKITFYVLRPSTTQNWKVAVTPGAVNFNPAVTIPTLLLPSSTVLATSTFSVAALATPSATLGLTPTPTAGAGGSFPYNQQTTDGSQFWLIPSITIALSAAYSDQNAWLINVTFTDIDAAGNVIGPEHIYGNVAIVNGTVSIGELRGEYGTSGDGYTRTHPFPGGTPTNLCKVRAKFYASNRADQNTTAWSNPAASTLQTDVGSGAGYLDIVVATAGAIPDGKILATRLDPTTLDVSIKQAPNTKLLGLNTTNIANVVYDSSFESGTLNYWTSSFSAGAGSAANIISSGGHSGGHYARLVPDTSGGFVISQLYEKAAHGCSSGDPIHGEAWFFVGGGAAGTIFLQLYFYDVSGVFLGSYVPSASATAATIGGSGGWYKLAVNGVAPATAIGFRVLVEYHESAGGTPFLDIDDIVADVIPSTAVQAASMAAASVTYANAAIAGNAIVDSNVASTNFSKLIADTVVFSADLIMSRGSGAPVVVMNNTGIALYGSGTASGSGVTPGVAGNATYSAAGITSQGYVLIQSSAIGIFGASVAGIQPSVTLTGSGLTLWSNNADTSKPYATFTSTQLQFIAGSSSVSISASHVTIVNGSLTSPVISGGSLTIVSGGVTLNMDATNFFMAHNSSSSVTCQMTGDHFTVFNSIYSTLLNPAGLSVTKIATSVSVTVSADLVAIFNGASTATGQNGTINYTKPGGAAGTITVTLGWITAWT